MLVGSWLTTSASSELLSSSNKLLSPPISLTPNSVCTGKTQLSLDHSYPSTFCLIVSLDLSESDEHPVDLSASRRHVFSSPPLSSVKSESIDLIDYSSPHVKQESTMLISNDGATLLEQSRSSTQSTKKYSNFTIEHLLSSSFRSSSTHQLLAQPSTRTNSIFTKKKAQHFSDHYLHRILHRPKVSRGERKPSAGAYSCPPRGVFLRYLFDSINDLIDQQNRIKGRHRSFTIDALEQLAEIACKLDTRDRTSLFADEKFTSTTYRLLSRQCRSLIRQIYQKCHQGKLPKRLNHNSKANRKRRILHFPLSMLNLLQMRKSIFADDESKCIDDPVFMSDIQRSSIDREETAQPIKSTCSHLQSDQITSNLDILLPNDGLVYEATIQPIDSYEDLLLVRLSHERQTYLIPKHDLCRVACPKVIPSGFHVLSNGSRVCAYWSTSLRGFHPAVVKEIPTQMDASAMVGLLFDDGDTGLIKLDEIRLLPDDYEIKGKANRFSRLSVRSSLANSEISFPLILVLPN